MNIEITPEMVERAAFSFYGMDDTMPWRDEPEYLKDIWRNMACMALEAALNPTKGQL